MSGVFARRRRDQVRLREPVDPVRRRTGVLVTFGLAYGPHKDRVFRANRYRHTG